MDFLMYVIFIGGCLILWKCSYYYFVNKATNPFEEDTSVPLKPFISDTEKRDVVLKQGFKEDEVPSDLDAIVIGSGIGGLATAAILAKTGKKVLVLEQHDQAGGCCHTFKEDGFEFDVGIHYVGEMRKHTLSKLLLDQISDGQIEWQKMNDEFDCVVFENSEMDPSFYPIFSGKEKQKNNLKNIFPREEEAIDSYYKLIFEADRSYRGAIATKFMALWLVKLLISTRLINKITNFFSLNRQTAQQVINSLTSNKKLRAVFCYCFGDFGTLPSECGFPMLAILIAHFSKGSFYPVGGASQIAHSIIPVIERSGGRVFVKAAVTEILLSNGKITGVRVRKGKKGSVDVLAPIVISNAGLHTTFRRLLPESVSRSSRLWELSAGRGTAAVSVFVGLNASAEDLPGIPKQKNFWIFNDTDIDKKCREYLNLSPEEAETTEPPLVFASFPSTKDPTWEQRYPNQTTMILITLSNYDWFSQWKQTQTDHRGRNYDELKTAIGYKMIDRVTRLLPAIKKHITYVSVGSPLTNNFYLGATHGEIYGLDHDWQRFKPGNTALLRPTTDIKGLFLTGQDITTCGFTPALWAGLMCAHQVLDRNLLTDLSQLRKQLKNEAKVSQQKDGCNTQEKKE